MGEEEKFWYGAVKGIFSTAHYGDRWLQECPLGAKMDTPLL